MTSPIPVVHLVSTLGIGGQEMVILSLVENMHRDRFSQHVLALHAGGPVAERIQALGVPVGVVGGSGLTGFKLIRKLADTLIELRPTILHTHNPAPHQLGAAARKLAGVPALIHTKHGRNNFPTRSRRWAEQIAGRFSDRIVAVSKDSAAVARTIDRVPESKLRVIHNGILLPEMRHQPVGTPASARVVHVARLNRIKDQPTLLRAAAIVRERVPEFGLDIVGDGPMREQLEVLARELDLSGAVTFHGMQEDVGHFLNLAQAFVLPSLSEGVSITLLEAMAAQLPCVATDVGGNPEVIEEGVTGHLIQVGDHVALADRICELLTNPENSRQMGVNGRGKVELEFNIKNTVLAYEEEYLALANRHVSVDAA